MKKKIIAAFLAASMVFVSTAPEASAFEKIDRAIMNMIRNMGKNRGNRGRRVQRQRRARASQVQPSNSERSA